MSTTDKSESSTPVGTSTQSGLDASSSSRLCRAMIRQAVEDAVKGSPKAKREAMGYLVSERFVLDCRSIGASPQEIGKLVVRFMNMSGPEQSEEIQKFKLLIRT